MLRNPDPDDWLMIRRDYHASNYSPLNQITRDNVKDLRLQWVWAMNEGGANQPAPLVHNGVVYLNNPGNVMQAIDGRTGDLIWENRYGTHAERRGHARHRHLRRQGLRRDERRAPGGARRQDRQDRLANDDRRSLEGQLRHQQRSARRQGQADSGAGRLPDLPGREMLHQRLRRRDRQRAVAVQHGRQAGRARRRLLGHAARICSAPAASRGSPAATIRF